MSSSLVDDIEINMICVKKERKQWQQGSTFAAALEKGSPGEFNEALPALAIFRRLF